MGQQGTGLHGGKTAHGSQYFSFENGRFYNGLLVVAFELEETVTNGGGLCCVIAPPNTLFLEEECAYTLLTLLVFGAFILFRCRPVTKRI